MDLKILAFNVLVILFIGLVSSLVFVSLLKVKPRFDMIERYHISTIHAAAQFTDDCGEIPTDQLNRKNQDVLLATVLQILD
ncbi:MAG TPA: hypothetical protein VJL87_02300 [Bdellovibrionota bacterium]|nr:hypothetical protein [Bdellovibrionota bacterium]